MQWGQRSHKCGCSRERGGVWLGMELGKDKECRRHGGCLVHGELQRRVGDGNKWRERLRREGRGGWDVQVHRWESNCNGWEAVAGAPEVVGWYLPVSVMDEKALTRVGVRMVVQMRRVAVGRSATGQLGHNYTQAVGTRCRGEWCRHYYQSKRNRCESS